MEVSIILKQIDFGGSDGVPEERTAVVVFDIHSDDIGTIEFNVDVVPEDDDRHGVDDAIMIARRKLVEFGTALVAAGEKYEIPRIFSPTSE